MENLPPKKLYWWETPKRCGLVFLSFTRHDVTIAKTLIGENDASSQAHEPFKVLDDESFQKLHKEFNFKLDFLPF